MRTITMAQTLTLALAVAAAPALAQTSSPASGANRSGQNAVSNQQSHDPLDGGGGSLLGAAAHNATTAQNATGVTTTQASTTQGVSLGYGVDTAPTAVGIAKVLDAAKAKTQPKADDEAKAKP